MWQRELRVIMSKPSDQLIKPLLIKRVIITACNRYFEWWKLQMCLFGSLGCFTKQHWYISFPVYFSAIITIKMRKEDYVKLRLTIILFGFLFNFWIWFRVSERTTTQREASNYTCFYFYFSIGSIIYLVQLCFFFFNLM